MPLAPSGLPPFLAQRAADRTLVMGVINVTPDSFSDGGTYLDADRAIARGRELIRQGADLVDVGGESTRPGAIRVSAEEELGRVIPVLRGLADAGVPASVDTTRAAVARAAVTAGAILVNDVSGGLADPEMLATVSDLGVPYVAMHWRGPASEMDRLATYDDVVAEVFAHLEERAEAAIQAGINADRLVLDPGLGFAKDAAHNWALLHALDRLVAVGYPVLIGASRKRFLGALLADPEPRPISERDAATAAVTTLAAAAGVWCVRVHDVRGSRDAVEVAAAWTAGVPGGEGRR